eukprot:m.132824 g.132824  ORF g.132824 m.132824 type:complete len:248 (-) comp29634_c0_seq1:378-1121(-)
MAQQQIYISGTTVLGLALSFVATSQAAPELLLQITDRDKVGSLNLTVDDFIPNAQRHGDFNYTCAWDMCYGTLKLKQQFDNGDQIWGSGPNGACSDGGKGNCIGSFQVLSPKLRVRYASAHCSLQYGYDANASGISTGDYGIEDGLQSESVAYFEIVGSNSTCLPSSTLTTTVSVGAVIMLGAMACFMIYIIIGIIVKKHRGAVGIEVIPNVDLWRELPGLIKDGCRFFCKKTVQRSAAGFSSYDQL